MLPEWVLKVCLVIVGFGSGMVVSGAVFAFIAMIGVVPRLAQKTNTQGYVVLYEEALIFGGIFGTSTEIINYNLPLPGLVMAVMSLAIGIFFGCLAMSLAEILNVIPILTRRARLTKGMFFFICAIALGKLAGSLAYYFVPGFYSNM